jgi:MoxR-like ATPase
VFTNLLLADEINRTPPKTQAALLEAMQERQVTVEGATRALERPFVVIATQNPIEYEGTYPLPEAQVDRFLLRARVGYPKRDDEWRILAGRIERASDEVALDQMVDAGGLLELQGALERVHVAERVGYYMVDLVAATRRDPSLELAGREFVTPDDVKAVAVPALAHRLALQPEQWVRRVEPDQVVRQILDRVPTPAPADLPERGSR